MDILRLPLIGNFLRWRWGRLVLQGLLLVIAALILYDGFTGPQRASENLATILSWIHYRGLVVLVLLLAGNLFCMACPFHLPRTLAARWSMRGWRWPRVLRNKWLAIGALFLIFWLYEWLDLWASPWLTAWVAVAYFVGAFVLEALFAESPFCKYICPLGSFNMVNATISPLQITARRPEVCRTCVGYECVTGSAAVAGCPTELYVPQIKSNMDCLFCLDCARACPHNNVALVTRSPLKEAGDIKSWLPRVDFALLALMLVFASLGNAFGMVPPVYALEQRLAMLLHTQNEAVLLLVIFGALDLLFPVLAGYGAAWLSAKLTTEPFSPTRILTRFAPAAIPLGFSVWMAHYGFHFATGALTVIPAFQNFLLEWGITLLGDMPNWRLAMLLPTSKLLPMQISLVVLGLGSSLWGLEARARQLFARQSESGRAMIPWAVLFLLIAVAAMATFSLPMEMRGTMMMSGN